MAAPSALTLTQAFRAWIGDGTFDLNTDTIKVGLLSSAATPNAATHSVWGDLSANEVANGNGYTTGGFSLGTNTFDQASGTAALKTTSAMPNWTGSGAGFAARYAVFYKSGTANAHVNPIIGWMLLDSAPADVSFAAGNTVTINMHANGWFTLT